MPITGRTAKLCHDQFLEHLRKLVSETLPTDRILVAKPTDNNCKIEFSREGGSSVPLASRKYGTIYFYLGQLVEAVPPASKKAKDYRLQTNQYWYRLLDQPDERADALIRWEYERQAPPDGNHARHHVQFKTATMVAAGADHQLDLSRLHTPTGWVTIEEVIRFLLVDLDVQPRSNDWPEVLQASERKFFAEFTGKRG